MNLYTTLDAVKRAAGATGTSRDTLWMEKILAASRRIDLFTGRAFSVVEATRYFDGACRAEVYVDDYLAISALTTDSELDGTFDGETWVQNTDWVARPYNTWPKFAIELHPAGDYSFFGARRYLKAVGSWGYGDGLRSSPWDLLSVTGTLADASDTSLTLSAAADVEAGMTLKIESEQVYVSAVTTTTATVTRGVNGTTAAAHAAAAIYVGRYPAVVTRACNSLAIGMMARDKHSGYTSEQIGAYRYTLANDAQEDDFLARALNGLVRPI